MDNYRYILTRIFGGKGSAEITGLKLNATDMPTPSMPPDQGNNKSSKPDDKWSDFDPTGLERAAKAARELDASAHMKEAVDLARHQEQMEQVEFQEKLKQAEYQHLEGRRYVDRLILQSSMNGDNLRRQKESVQRQESMRRATPEHEMKLRRKNEEADSLTIWEFITYAVCGVTLSAGYIYAKHSIGAAVRIFKPALVRQTDRLTFLNPIKMTKRFFSKPENPLRRVVLKPSLEEEIRGIVISTRNAKQDKGVYRNLLLHGPDGTGKALFSKELAMHSGMDFAMVCGYDVAWRKYNKEAVDDLFDWANTSRRGLMIFVDRADELFEKRDTEITSDAFHPALKAFLYRTRYQSRKYMLVFACDQLEKLHGAIKNHVNDIFEFDLPGREQRERLVRKYFDEYILTAAMASGDRRLKLGDMDIGETCSQIADKTKGFSGRDISRLVRWCQMDGYISADRMLTEQILHRRVADSVRIHYMSSGQTDDENS